MAKPSAFRDFIAALRRDWRTALPTARPIPASVGAAGGMTVPRASTFYLGLSRRLGMHVLVYFESSSKSWEVGQFTTDVILAKREDAPVVWMRFGAIDDAVVEEGCYRVGSFLGGQDKLWHLLRSDSSSAPLAWRASNYADPAQVIAEAIADVTRDVRTVLGRLRVTDS